MPRLVPGGFRSIMTLRPLILAAAGLILTVYLLRLVFSPQHLYDWGFYGAYPVRRFHSFDLPEPTVNFAKWDSRCDDGAYYLVSPNGKYVTDPGPVILDTRGNLVWTTNRFEHVSNFNIQSYKGKDYLTFWSSHLGVIDGYGRGSYYMLDEHYEIFRKLGPVGDDLPMGDMHEFKITSDGTALMTIYNPIPADLTSIGGSPEGWILDGMFQEIDIETGSLLFEWKASDHVSFNETIRWYSGKDNGYRPTDAFDYYHINSLDKDRNGNYIVSARHPQSIQCVSGTNGSVLWNLGGVKNSFTDITPASSNPEGEENPATKFAYQHHVRISPNDTLTLFDNSAAERWGPSTPHTYSRGLVIQLDQEHLTAELLASYHDPSAPYLAISQGSAQLIASPQSRYSTGAGSKMLLGYGQKPAWTEFDAETGEALCEVRLVPKITFPLAWTGTYRTFKHPWVGTPKTPPKVALKEGDRRLFVSWNGATEVWGWRLEGADFAGISGQGVFGRVGNGGEEGGKGWKEISVQEKGEFETLFELAGEDMAGSQYLRVVALDRAGRELGRTEVVSRKWGNSPSRWLDNIIHAVVAGVVVLCLLVISLVFWRLGVFRVIRQRWAAGRIRLEPVNRLRNWRYGFRLPHEVGGGSPTTTTTTTTIIPKWMMSRSRRGGGDDESGLGLGLGLGGIVDTGELGKLNGRVD